MQLWMSRSVVTQQYNFWREEPDIIWTEKGEPRIGYNDQGTEKEVCEMINVHKLFPALEIPPGEVAEVEVVEMHNGYYIGFIE